MNSTKKFQFKTIDVNTNGVKFRDPFPYNAYGQLVPRKDLVRAWKEETRVREEELETLRNNITDTE